MCTLLSSGLTKKNLFLFYKVLIALQEKKIKYESELIDIHAGDQDAPWYMLLNPAGTVPVLQDGGTIITESEDIVQYVDKEFPTSERS
jgi:glutathione S-transferase